MERFILEIYEPGSSETVLASLETATPLVVAVGEILLTAALVPDRSSRTLTVTRIEHALWQSPGGVVQKRMVFTAART